MTDEVTSLSLPDTISSQAIAGFAALVFTSPRSEKWKRIWGMCQSQQHAQEGKNFLVIFESTPEAVGVLGSIIQEVYSWKSAYLFIQGKLVDKNSAGQWLSCYLRSFEHSDPERTYCLREDKYFHFRHHLTNTARPNEAVAFITPCVCTASFVKFSDSLPSTFKEQFHTEAVKRGHHLCPRYIIDNFKGPFIRDGAYFPDMAIKIGVEYEAQPIFRRLWNGAKKVVTYVAVALIALVVLVAIFGK